MKKKILLLMLITTSVLFSQQVVLIPNGGFNTDTSGWSITGTDTSISNIGGALSIDVSGAYTRNFILSSPQIYLDANKTYKLHSDYRNVQLDPIMMTETSLGGFTGVFLKDLAGSTVVNVGFSNCQTGGYYDMCHSSSFSVAISGTYYLEYTGQQNPSDTQYELDNVGFEEVIINTFSGTVSLDVDNNSCATSSIPFENLPILLTETTSNTSFYTNTDANGDFIFETAIDGNYVTQINQPLYTSSPVNYSTTITSGTNTIANQNFCVVANSVVADISISIIPTTDARPGFDTSYRVYFTNLGTTSLSGAFTLNYDNSLITFLNASMTPGSTTSTSLNWNYVGLTSLETRYVDVNFNINTPPTVNNGDILNFTASITPLAGDAVPSNNSFALNQITIGSYDPNDVTILQGPEITHVQALEDVFFRIRFQNTGTASAININVNTSLDSDIDVSTFTPIYASHNYTTTIIGSNVNFKFNSINLADSTSDEPNSHGFVVFKAKLNTGFSIGDLVESLANIYFDYNLPITTNTATTQIPAALNTKGFETIYFSIYPNPTKNQLTVSIQAEAKYSIFNINGQELQKGRLSLGDNNLNISKFSNGLYFLRVQTEKGITTKKLIKE